MSRNSGYCVGSFVLLILLAIMCQSSGVDQSQVARLISQEIASCVLELIGLESQERDYLAMLERKAELEARIAWLQRMEGPG